MNTYIIRYLVLSFGVMVLAIPSGARASFHFENFKGSPPIHAEAGTSKTPKGIAPAEIKKWYGLPSDGGKGTIAIVTTYISPGLAKDLADFSKQFSLPGCTESSGCLTVHIMSAGKGSKTVTPRPSASWALESALDTQWAHAIAPRARILVVIAASPSGAHLLQAVDYAAAQKGVVSVSMSWGGSEFPEEVNLDSHFDSSHHVAFFASSGDSGAGASWPASSPNVIGVGGTSLIKNKSGALSSEEAWKGSGGGVSTYEKLPSFQSLSKVLPSNSMRAIPDVSYDADPHTGFPVVMNGTWKTVGGTSAGAPQWAAIATLASSITLSNIYSPAGSAHAPVTLRDIVSGKNGLCGYYCTARSGYDYVTGLGSIRSLNL